MATQVHPSTVIDEGARIGDRVTIGPFCHISSKVELADGVTLDAHVRIMDGVTVGQDTSISAGVVLGGAPQITPYIDAETRLIIGSKCTVRENATVHRGSTRGDGTTVIGNNCYLMDGSHVGHDCRLDESVILAHGAALGGHSHLAKGVYVGGMTAVHQWTRIGAYAFIGGVIPLTRDVIPFAIVNGSPARLEGLNVRGLARRGMSTAKIRKMLAAYTLIFRENFATLKERLVIANERYPDDEDIQSVIEFAQLPSKRGLCIAS